ncbi:MAG TPA: TonB-dependent receptor [Acidobacteriota bacterium]|nr:TonB-dependent receptor [Acidobacteriota bacterium]
MRCIRIISGIGLLLVAVSGTVVQAGAGGGESSDSLVISQGRTEIADTTASAASRSIRGAVRWRGEFRDMGIVQHPGTFYLLHGWPNRGCYNFVALAPGAIQTSYDAPPHVRGGATHEVAYYFDGMSLQDPFTNESFTPFSISTAGVWKVLRSGNIGPQYGQAMSGIADFRTTGSTDDYRGTFLASTDNFHGENADYVLYSGTLAGPLTALMPGLSFSAAVEQRKLGNRNPGGQDAWDWQWNWRGRWDWKPTGRTYRAALGTIGYYDDRHVIPRAWLFNSEHAARVIDQNYIVWGRVNNEFSPTTSLTLSANWFFAKQQDGDGLHFDDLWAYGRPGRQTRVDETGLFRSWDDMFLDPDSQAVGVLTPLHTEVRDTAIVVDLPNGDTATHTFIIAGDESALWSSYYQRENAYLGARADLTTAWSPGDDRHEFLIGSEIQRHTVRMYEHVNPTVVWRGANGGFLDVNRYGYDELGEATDDAAHPVNWATYTRGNFDLGDVRVTAGLRLDYYDYDTQRLRDPVYPLDPDRFLELEDPTNEQRKLAGELDPADLEDRDAEIMLSPRLGIAIPIREGTSLHASYGRYVQRPRFQNVYLGYDFLEYLVQTGKYTYALGNPDLEPEVVSAIEVGWQQSLTSQVDCGITAFYKDYDDLVGAVEKRTKPYSVTWYDNIGDATAKGLELQLQARPGRGARVLVNYTLQEARVTTPVPPSDFAWFPAFGRQTGPRAWDRRHTLTLLLDLHRPLTANPEAGLLADPFAGAGLTVAFTAGSGLPYAPGEISDEVSLYAMRSSFDGSYETGPAVYRLDLRAEKEFHLGRGAPKMGLYLWVINLLDRDNAVHVYRGTGEPDNTGWLETEDGQEFTEEYAQLDDTSLLTGEEKYRLREADPANLDIPRQIRFGLWVGF